MTPDERTLGARRHHGLARDLNAGT
jgi:hypothetical protein